MSDRNDRNAKIIEEFRANGGTVAMFAKQPLIILHTTGAKSGAERLNPLARLDYDGHLYVFATFGGRDDNPSWYHNLKANPRVQVELGTDRFDADAIELTGAERDRIYAEQVSRNAGFGEYEEATSRVIPVIELVRRPD